MSRKLDPGANLESLGKHAKNWLKALKAGDPVARERLAIVVRTPWEAGHCSTVGRSLGNWQLAEFVQANASKIGECLVIAIR